MRSNVTVQDLAPSVFDDEEAVQELERQRGYGEEIEGCEHIAIIAEKHEPVLGAIATGRDVAVEGTAPLYVRRCGSRV
jgi:hypothetical protein